MGWIKSTVQLGKPRPDFADSPQKQPWKVWLFLAGVAYWIGKAIDQTGQRLRLAQHELCK
jgi:hypothetical protein